MKSHASSIELIESSAPRIRGAARRTANPGFTIVELLIVIVVIGILAAITLVAYNGIQERARTASVSLALNQASKKLALYQVENGSYPAALSSVGISDSSSASYQYTVNNSASPATYCVTATNGSVSYKITATTTPQNGGCAGHGVGGVAAVTNLATTPKPFTGLNSSYSIYWGVGGAGASTFYNDAGLGRTVWRATWNTPSTASGGSYWESAAVVTAGTRYQLSQTIRSSKTQTVGVQIVWVNAAGTVQTGNANLGLVNLTAGVSQRIGGSDIAPAGTGKMRITAYLNSGTWASGDTLDTWDTMFVQSDTSNLYNYADGDSVNWVWNGAPNNSTSTGPPL